MYALLNTTDHDKLETVIKANADMLLFFRKYPLLKKSGLKDYSIRSINPTITSYFIHEVTWQIRGFELQFEKEENWRDLIDKTLLTTPFLLRKGQPEEWETWRKKFIDVVKKDPELRKFVNASLMVHEERLKTLHEARASLEE